MLDRPELLRAPHLVFSGGGGGANQGLDRVEWRRGCCEQRQGADEGAAMREGVVEVSDEVQKYRSEVWMRWSRMQVRPVACVLARLDPLAGLQSAEFRLGDLAYTAARYWIFRCCRAISRKQRTIDASMSRATHDHSLAAATVLDRRSKLIWTALPFEICPLTETQTHVIGVYSPGLAFTIDPDSCGRA